MAEVGSDSEHCDPPDDLLCPVCLDLLYQPHVTEPCHHTFCDPCLRRLARTNPFNCPCPLCRAPIRLCRPLKEFTKNIQNQHENLYLKRAKLEQLTPVYSQPLPWKPSWRNLMKGQPMGGNRFIPLHSEYVRAGLQQMSYYFLPLVVAALINTGIFTFMIRLVDLVPSLLAMIFKSLGVPVPSSNSSLDQSFLPSARTRSLDVAQTDLLAYTRQGFHFPEGDNFTTDATFYYLLYALTVATAAAGQFYMSLDLRLRLSDQVLVLLVMSAPLLLVPAATDLVNHLMESFWISNPFRCSGGDSVNVMSDEDEWVVNIVSDENDSVEKFESGVETSEETWYSEGVEVFVGHVVYVVLSLFSGMNCASALMLVVSIWFMHCVDVAS